MVKKRVQGYIDKNLYNEVNDYVRRDTDFMSISDFVSRAIRFYYQELSGTEDSLDEVEYHLDKASMVLDKVKSD